NISELIAQTQACVIDLRQIHSSDDAINHVAGMGIDALNDLTKQIEALDVASMSKPVPVGAPPGAAASLIAAVVTEDPLPLLHAFSQVANAQEQLDAKNQLWKQTVQAEFAHVMADAH